MTAALPIAPGGERFVCCRCEHELRGPWVGRCRSCGSFNSYRNAAIATVEGTPAPRARARREFSFPDRKAAAPLEVLEVSCTPATACTPVHVEPLTEPSQAADADASPDVAADTSPLQTDASPRARDDAFPGLVVQSLSQTEAKEIVRVPTGVASLDAVLGGGAARGDAIMMLGDRGIGKSTLLLQMLGHVATAENRACFITGEQSIGDVAANARRCGVFSDYVDLIDCADLDQVLAYIDARRPIAAVLDSLHTLRLAEFGRNRNLELETGAKRIDTVAERTGSTLWIIVQQNAEGGFAGPKAAESNVDVVLKLEAPADDEARDVAHLRCKGKNRHGPKSIERILRVTDHGLEDWHPPCERWAPGFSGV